MSGGEDKQPEVAQEASAEPMEQEAAPAAAGTKRKAEEDPAAEGGEQPAAKAAKTEGVEAAEATEEAGEAAEEDGGEAAAEGERATEKSEPVQIGYKTFNSGKEAKAYYHSLISKLRKYQNLNDYEFHMVHELIKQGHPEAARKLEGGVRAIQIREVEIGHAVTACFFLIHDDGSDEDVSYRKCLGSLFPELAKEMAAGSGAKAGSRGGKSPGGRGRGRGRGRGGRGGRGGGRGRN